MNEALKGHLAMLCFSALVAGSFALGAMAAPHIAPAVLNAVRFVIAALILGVAVMATGGLPRRAVAAPWRYLVLGGAMGFYFVLMFEALKTVAPVSAAAIFTLTPILSAMFGYLLLRQITTPRMALALAVGGCGAVWVIFRADLQALLAFAIGRGEILFFVGCVSHAFYTPMVRVLNRGEKPLVFSFGTMVAAALLLFVFGAKDVVATDWAALPVIVWITIGYTALMATAMTFVLLQFASLRLPSAKVMAYTYLTPSWVLWWQIGLGHDVPPMLILIGVGLTIVALLMLLRDDSTA